MALVQPTRVLNQGGLFVIDGLPAIPEIGELFPSTRRWHAEKLQPCPGPAAWRRHQRRGEPICDPCKAWRAAWDLARPPEAQQRRHAPKVDSRPDPLDTDAPSRLQMGLPDLRDRD